MAGLTAAATVRSSIVSGSGTHRLRRATVWSAIVPCAESRARKYPRRPSGRRPTASMPGITGSWVLAA
jgi:hypothetical protein